MFIGAELGVSAQLGKTTEVNRTTAGNNTTTTTTTTNADKFPLGAVGLKFGYTHFFNKWIGLRGYATYHYVYDYGYEKTNKNVRITDEKGALTAAGAGQANPSTTTTSSSRLYSYHQVAANIEAVFKFAEVGNTAVGGFVGLGAGYADSYARVHTQSAGAGTITTTQGPSGFVLPVNVGLEVYMGKRHNASLNFRLPTIATNLVTTDATGSTITTNELRQLIITLGYYYKF